MDARTQGWFAIALKVKKTPTVDAAVVAALSTPMDLPNELELLQVVLGGCDDRIACSCCSGTGVTAGPERTPSLDDAGAVLCPPLADKDKCKAKAKTDKGKGKGRAGVGSAVPTQPHSLGKRTTVDAVWLFEDGVGGWDTYGVAMRTLLEAAWAEGGHGCGGVVVQVRWSRLISTTAHTAHTAHCTHCTHCTHRTPCTAHTAHSVPTICWLCSVLFCSVILLLLQAYSVVYTVCDDIAGGG